MAAELVVAALMVVVVVAVELVVVVLSSQTIVSVTAFLLKSAVSGRQALRHQVAGDT